MIYRKGCDFLNFCTFEFESEYRKVGTESQRTHRSKVVNGFYAKYMGTYKSLGLDIGYAGYKDGCDTILPTAIGVDKNYPGYDGKTLPFEDESMDYVYSSHCLEHISNDVEAIAEWFRVLKVGAHLVLIVPHKFLYEKKRNPPSRWNRDHKRFYTPASLLSVVESVLAPNTYRVRLLEDGDQHFDYSKSPSEHSDGQYEITLVIQKIPKPSWDLA